MFTELKQLLARRSLTITVAALENEHLRVNVVPHSLSEDQKVNDQIKYSHKSEVAALPDEAIKALTTPLSITGTAEEIDEKFSTILTNYVESHARLQDSVDRASDDIAAALKAIDERNKAKSKEKQSKRDQRSKSEGEASKKDDNLPLWWTNPSVPAPGASTSTPTAVENAAAGKQPMLPSET
jgi:PRTRC genetic system protein E